MKRVLVTALAALTYFYGAAAALSFGNTAKPVITITPDAASGLDAIYVLWTTAGVTASYTAEAAGANATWARYSNLGGAYAEPITNVSYSGRQSTITLDARDMGYIIEDGGRQHCFWIVNYADHAARLESLAPDAEQDCDRVTLSFAGYADRITYYSINGRAAELSRQMTLEYKTLVCDEETMTYNQTTTTEEIDHITTTLSAPAPLCDTEFTLTGDRFLSKWGIAQSITSPSIAAHAVAAHTKAEQQLREVENEQKPSDSEALGGSAPCEITFTAAVSDAAIFHEWQMAKDPDFGILDNTFTDLELAYTFQDQGTTYVRFRAANADGTCEYLSDTYQVFVGESDLKCPNAFSPFTSPGVNDEWRVSYKSIITFECHIFNKWGTKMATLTDPSQGWDGRYAGKEVPAGVYYYVINAEGADGKQYKLSGDINIIGYSYKGDAAGSDDTSGDAGAADTPATAE